MPHQLSQREAERRGERGAIDSEKSTRLEEKSTQLAEISLRPPSNNREVSVLVLLPSQCRLCGSFLWNPPNLNRRKNISRFWNNWCVTRGIFIRLKVLRCRRYYKEDVGLKTFSQWCLTNWLKQTQTVWMGIYLLIYLVSLLLSFIQPGVGIINEKHISCRIAALNVCVST